MVQSVLEFVVTSVAAALNLLLSVVGALATLATSQGDQNGAPLFPGLLSNMLLSWISLFWLVGTSRLLVVFLSDGELIDAVPFVLFLFPGLVYPWWMASRLARYSGLGHDVHSACGMQSEAV